MEGVYEGGRGCVRVSSMSEIYYRQDLSQIKSGYHV